MKENACYAIVGYDKADEEIPAQFVSVIDNQIL